MRVAAARRARKWTQRQLGEELGLDASAVSRLEKGLRAVRLGEAALIARVLRMNIDSLVYGDDDPVAQLRRSRNDANFYMHETRDSAVQMVFAFAQIAELLTETPELFLGWEMDPEDAKALHPSRHRQTGNNPPFPPTNVEEYFDWVLTRMRAIFDVSVSDNRIYVEDARLVERLVALVHAVVEDVASTVPLPTQDPEALGRGLASLIPVIEESDDVADT